MKDDRFRMELGNSIREPLGEYPMPWAQGVIPWGNPNDAKAITFLHSGAYVTAYNHGKSSANKEITGILVGNAYFCPQAEKTYVIVEAAIPATTAIGAKTQVVFDHQAWSEVLQAQQRDYPTSRIVGWYHTHPGFGAFFSQDDDFWHKTAFTNPWQVALVLDPLRNQACFFGWSGSGIDHITGFYELLDKGQKASLVAKFATTWEFRKSLERPPVLRKQGKRHLQAAPVVHAQGEKAETAVGAEPVLEQTEMMAPAPVESANSESISPEPQEKKRALIRMRCRGLTGAIAASLAVVLVALVLLSAWEPWWIDTHGSRFIVDKRGTAKLEWDNKTGKLSWTSPINGRVFIWETPPLPLSRSKEPGVSYNLVAVRSMTPAARLQSGLLVTIPVSQHARIAKTLYRSNTAWYADEKSLQSPIVYVLPLETSQPGKALIFLHGKDGNKRERVFVTITEGTRTHSRENWQELRSEQTEPEQS